LPRKCGSLDISQPYGHLTGTALPYLYSFRKEIALVSLSVHLPGDLVTGINYDKGNIWVKDTVIKPIGKSCTSIMLNDISSG
jgi:hypothetical protein